MRYMDYEKFRKEYEKIWIGAFDSDESFLQTAICLTLLHPCTGLLIKEDRVNSPVITQQVR